MEVTLRWGVSGGGGEGGGSPGSSGSTFADRRGRAHVACRKSLDIFFYGPRMIVAFHTLLKQDGANKYGAWAL